MNNINNNSKDLAKYIRIQSLKIANKVKCSHIGSVLSCADILAVLYSKILEIDHKEKWKLRDRFIMSKGHASSGLYSCFAGIGLINESDLIQHCQIFLFRQIIRFVECTSRRAIYIRGRPGEEMYKCNECFYRKKS